LADAQGQIESRGSEERGEGFDPVQEYHQCADDVLYFIERYIKIKHPAQGVIPFEMYDFQKELVTLINDKDRVIVNKSRQTGVSTLTAAYALWMALFKRHKSIMILSKKDDDAKKFLAKIKLAYKELPEWLRRGVKTIKSNEHQFHLATGSTIEAEASGQDAGRSESLSMLVMDEAAFMQHAETIWDAANPTLSRGNGKCVIISTPNGIGNFYYDKVEGAKKKGREPAKWNQFHYFFCHWRDVPEYDDAWYEIMRPQFTDRKWAQEYEGSFIGSGKLVLSEEHIQEVKNRLIQPIIIRNEDMEPDANGKLWVWEKPRADRMYGMGVDTARGDGTDNYAIVVLDMISMKEVAEYYGKCDIYRFAKMCSEVGFWYHEAYVVCENNTYGKIVLDRMIEDFGYSNMYYQRDTRSGNINFKKPGFLSAPSTKMRITDGTIQAFKLFHLASPRILKEMQTFYWINNTAQARKGSNDDLMTALGMITGNLDAMIQDDPSTSDGLAERLQKAYYGKVLFEGYQEVPDDEMQQEFEYQIGDEVDGMSYLGDNGSSSYYPPDAGLFADNHNQLNAQQHQASGDRPQGRMVYKRGILQRVDNNQEDMPQPLDSNNLNQQIEQEFGFGFLSKPPPNR